MPEARSTRCEDHGSTWPRPCRAVAMALLVAVVNTACGWVQPGVTMTKTEPTLPGQWTRSSGGPCADGYAHHLRIEPQGLYFGSTEPPGGFTWWDGGTWRVTAPGRISLSTANDAVISYGFSLNGDTLSFTDDKNCQFAFRRVA